jgi:hypothetical protein
MKAKHDVKLYFIIYREKKRLIFSTTLPIFQCKSWKQRKPSQLSELPQSEEVRKEPQTTFI